MTAVTSLADYRARKIGDDLSDRDLSPQLLAAWRDVAAAVGPHHLVEGNALLLELSAVLLAALRRDPLSIDEGKVEILHHFLGLFGVSRAEQERLMADRKEQPNGDH